MSVIHSAKENTLADNAAQLTITIEVTVEEALMLIAALDFYQYISLVAPEQGSRRAHYFKLAARIDALRLLSSGCEEVPVGPAH